MSYVFISYARKDTNHASQLIEKLRALEIDTWYDQDIDIGSPSVHTKITEQVRAASAVVVVWSENSVSSEWVLAEAKSGLDHHKLVPVTIDNCSIPLPFSEVQTANLASWNGSSGDHEWVRIIKSLSALLNRPGLASWCELPERPTAEVLQGWLTQFPGDPLAETAWRNIELEAVARARFDVAQARAQSAQKETPSRPENTEIESKLASNVNSQIKFTIQENQKEMHARLIFIFQELGYNIKDNETTFSPSKQSDDYYDDLNGSLLFHGYSLRARAYENYDGVRITLKQIKDQGPVRHAYVSRKQYGLTFPSAEIEYLMNDPVSLVKRLTSGEVNITVGRLHHKVSIHNHRSNINLYSEIGSYRVSIDKYYYENPTQQIYSEYYYELEVECTSDDNICSDIDRISSAISNTTALKPSRIAKFERAMTWITSPELNIFNCYVASINVYKSSKYTPVHQRQMIQFLAKEAKDFLREAHATDINFVPTGSGFAIVADDKAEFPEIIFKMFEILRIKKEERLLPSFDVTCSICFGSVFKFSDIFERLSFAGDAIVTALRMNACADSGAVVICDTARQKIKASGRPIRYAKRKTYKLPNGTKIAASTCSDLQKRPAAQKPALRKSTAAD